MISLLLYAFLIDLIRIFNKLLCWWAFLHWRQISILPRGQKTTLGDIFVFNRINFCIFVQFCLSSVQICTPECVEHVHVEAKDNFQDFIFSASRWLSVDSTKDITRLVASSPVCWDILQALKVALLASES